MIFTRLVNFPITIPALVIKDYDGNYNVYLNQNHGYELQREALLHEINHIRKRHFDRTDEDLLQLEKEANEGTLLRGVR